MPEKREAPASWRDEEGMKRRVVLDVSLLDLLAVDGAVVLACKHPGMGLYIRPLLEGLLDTIEAVFVEASLEEPPHGWRGGGRITW